MRNIITIVLIFALPAFSSAQKIGVLPFEDASGVGAQFGENVAKCIRSEFLKNKKVTPKSSFKTNPQEMRLATVDVDKAVELGKKNGVEFVVIGTILEAQASGSSSGVGGISILSQSVGSSLRTVSATITIQGDLISVKDGKLPDTSVQAEATLMRQLARMSPQNGDV